MVETGPTHESFKGSILAEALSDLNSFLVRLCLYKRLAKQEFLQNYEEINLI